MIRKNYQEKLKLLNYELLTTISPKSKEDFYEKLSDNLNEIFGFIFSYLYLFDKPTNSFNLLSATNGSYILKNKIQDNNYRNAIESGQITISIYENEKDIFEYREQDINLVAIPIHPKNGPVGMVICGYSANERPITEEAILILKEEVEKIFNVTYESLLLKTREQRHQLLFEITTKFLVLTNKTDILTEIISSIRRLYPEIGVNLLLSQDHDQTLNLPIKTIELNDQTASSQSFLNGEIQIENRIHEKDTCIYAPLKGHQGVYGVLQIIVPGIEVLSEELEFIRKFSNTAGLAIESTILYQNSNHLVSDLKLINDLTHQLNSQLDLAEITRLVKNQISQICYPEEIGFIYDTHGKSANQFDVLEGSTDFFQTLTGHGFIKEFINKLVIEKEPFFSGDYKSTSLNIPYHSVMVIPMENAGTVNGFVMALHSDPYAFNFDHFKLLQSIIRHSTLAFVNTILAEKLQRAASTDYLTQLYSRNYFDDKIIQHMDKGELGTLILFDIDDFKQINDKFGHYVGDEVIKQVASIIMENIEERDIAARWGGEELAIYLPSTDLSTGVQLARAINTEVENFTEPKVTLSAGVSSWISGEKDSPRNFFIRADKALYEAKSIGKNCVVKYSMKEQVAGS